MASGSQRYSGSCADLPTAPTKYRSAIAVADLVVLTDIYPSGTEPIPGVTGKLVVNAVLDEHPERLAARDRAAVRLAEARALKSAEVAYRQAEIEKALK